MWGEAWRGALGRAVVGWWDGSGVVAVHGVETRGQGMHRQGVTPAGDAGGAFAAARAERPAAPGGAAAGAWVLEPAARLPLKQAVGWKGTAGARPRHLGRRRAPLARLAHAPAGVQA